MAKTITLRVDDDHYGMFKAAAKGQMRSISNFIEYAALSYLLEESHVSDSEMKEIESNSGLLENFKMSQKDIDEGNYKIVR